MIIRTSEQILAAALNRLTRETPVTTTTAGSVARTIFELFGEEMAYNYRLMDANTSRRFLASAGGDVLEKFGQMFGVTRTSTPSAIDANEGRIYFYLNSTASHVPGTSDIQNTTGSDITIPAGTVISTAEVGPYNNPISWRTTAAASISVGKHMTYVSVEPIYSYANTVGAGSMVFHNLTTANLYVYNREDLEAKPNIESDTNLRFRISSAIELAAKGNTYALRLAALGVSGVRDCTIVPLAHGVGTVKVVVVLEDPNASDAATILSNVTTAVRDAASAGDIISIARPTSTAVGLKAYAVGASSTRTKDLARTAVIRYLSSLGVGDPIVPARIINEAISISPEITDFVIVDGGFTLGGKVSVFTRIPAGDDEQFYPDPANITIL